MDKDLEWAEVQLALVRWHLDAANSASRERARIHVQQATEAHARTTKWLMDARVDKEARERLAREHADLKARLDAASSGLI